MSQIIFENKSVKLLILFFVVFVIFLTTISRLMEMEDAISENKKLNNKYLSNYNLQNREPLFERNRSGGRPRFKRRSKFDLKSSKKRKLQRKKLSFPSNDVITSRDLLFPVDVVYTWVNGFFFKLNKNI